MGSVTFVGPTIAHVNLPVAYHAVGRDHHGATVPGGEVGEFVVIEVGDMGVFGRLIEVKLPERDRLSVEPNLGRQAEAHPVGTVQLLSTLQLGTWAVTTGIRRYPRLGSPVYSAHPELVRWIVESQQRSRSPGATVTMHLADVPSAGGVAFEVTPERLFGRHCAILGTTGGGKSWTVARLLQEAARYHSKIILFDASGEFHTLEQGVRHVHFGYDPVPRAGSVEVVFPYRLLTESDLFAIFTPSGQSQGPKLRAAMKSLKLIKLVPGMGPTGVLKKAGAVRLPVEQAMRQHGQALADPAADFEITALASQLVEECVWPTGQGTFANQYGAANQNELGYCMGLITRIEATVSSPHLAPLFLPGTKKNVVEVIREFLQADEHRVLRISLKYLSFAHNAREIVANAVGRFLLTEARDGRMASRAVVVVVDEAHQFLSKTLGDEGTRHALDAFALIAKEGRKFELSLCLATQRPRDIPEDVLSQMGTLIVHRLINDRDREVVERASGDIDKSAAAFLPTLGSGEAVVVGVDFPMPLQVQVVAPKPEPDSKGSNFQSQWGNT